MALPTPVNGQITDAVTQTNVKVVAEAPAMAMGAIYQSLAHSTGILYENATSSQQQIAICGAGRDEPGRHPDLQRRHHGGRGQCDLEDRAERHAGYTSVTACGITGGSGVLSPF